MQTRDTILVGFDHNHESGNKVLVIGRKRLNQSVEIINAFQGEEAEELYSRLVTKKVSSNG